MTNTIPALRRGSGRARVSTRMRPWILAALLSVALGCSQNTERIGKNQPPPPAPRPLVTQSEQAPAAQSERDRLGTGTPPGISGEVRLAPELEGKIGPNAVLFVFARRPGGGPIAAKRLGNPELPVRYFIGQDAVMFEGEAFEGPIEIEARISQSGTAGPPSPGDLSGGVAENPVTVGDSEPHDIVIDTES